MDLNSINDNYKRICENISSAAQKNGTAPESIELVAVTKTVSVDIVNHSIGLGVRHIGENKVQELGEKFPQLIKDKLKISVIGHLQSNKAKRAVELADMIQSVDSLHIAQEISKRAQAMNKKIECLLEINVGNEDSKSGVSYDNAEELLLQIAEFPSISMLGFMIIPPVDENISNSVAYFEKIHKLFIDIGAKNNHNSNVNMKYLSMGMSADYEAAILSGANMVRIGSALYGGRSYIK